MVCENIIVEIIIFFDKKLRKIAKKFFRQNILIMAEVVEKNNKI